MLLLLLLMLSSSSSSSSSTAYNENRDSPVTAPPQVRERSVFVSLFVFLFCLLLLVVLFWLFWFVFVCLFVVCLFVCSFVCYCWWCYFACSDLFLFVCFFNVCFVKYLRPSDRRLERYNNQMAYVLDMWLENKMCGHRPVGQWIWPGFFFSHHYPST